CAAPIGAGQHHEQRCSIDTSVVSSEWNLAERRHLAKPRFVKYFSGLGIILRVGTSGLRLREKRQHPARDIRGQPQTLQCRDDAIPAESRVEPGDTRSGIDPGL